MCVCGVCVCGGGAGLGGMGMRLTEMTNAVL